MQFFVLSFFLHLGIDVRGAGVGIILASLTVEIVFEFEYIWHGSVIVYTHEAFVQGSGINQWAVHAEVLITSKSSPTGINLDTLEVHDSRILVKKVLMVGTDGDVDADLVLKVQTNKPKVEKILFDALDQQVIAANGEQDL